MGYRGSSRGSAASTRAHVLAHRCAAAVSDSAAAARAGDGRRRCHDAGVHAAAEDGRVDSVTTRGTLAPGRSALERSRRRPTHPWYCCLCCSARTGHRRPSQASGAAFVSFCVRVRALFNAYRLEVVGLSAAGCARLHVSSWSGAVAKGRMARRRRDVRAWRCWCVGVVFVGDCDGAEEQDETRERERVEQDERRGRRGIKDEMHRALM